MAHHGLGGPPPGFGPWFRYRMQGQRVRAQGACLDLLARQQCKAFFVGKMAIFPVAGTGPGARASSLDAWHKGPYARSTRWRQQPVTRTHMYCARSAQ